MAGPAPTTARAAVPTTAPLPVRPPVTVCMTTRDGVRLDADVYMPDAPGPFPVLLMRQPYGRRIASTAVYAHPSWYAARGYIVAIQDVRGTGSSGGKFALFETEAEDGADAVAWAAGLPNAGGTVGMYGFSYQGNAQLLALAGGAPALRALCPAMIGWDLYGDWAYEGGAFRLAAGMGWALQMAAEQARRREDGAAYQALCAAAHDLPLREEVPSRPRVLRDYARYSHYDEWLANPLPGPYWDRIAPRALLEPVPVTVPMLHIGGWYDQMLMGTLDGYADLSARARAPQHLVVGPWTHLPWGRKTGAVDFGPAAESPVDRLQLAWFDRFLKGQDTGIDRDPPVRLFDLGARCWRGLREFPAPEPAPLHLGGSGLAAPTVSAGRLLAEPTPPPAGGRSYDILVHDPWRPMPSLGGANAVATGMQDRSALDGRGDVCCYTTAALTAALRLAGRVELELHVEADAPCFDVSAVLSEVTPDGRALVLSEGYRRVEPGAPTRPLRLPMRALCTTVPAGHALRLSLAGASFPAFPVNPGTGAEAAETRLIDCQVITLLIRWGPQTPSRLLLPVMADGFGDDSGDGAGDGWIGFGPA